MLGIINATNEFDSLSKLTKHRSLAALPFGGRYRLIDFMLSNMVNSGIHSVAIFTGHENRSIMDHLGSGKQWDLDRKRDGLFVFTPNSRCGKIEFGSFFHLYRNIDYLLRSKQEYVVITAAHIVTSINFKPILLRHIEMQSDITEVQYQDRSLQTYIIKKELLLSLIQDYKDTENMSIMDIVRNNPTSLRIHPYEAQEYVAIIDSIESYYENSLAILNPTAWKQLFHSEAPIYTKVKDEPPTRYGKDAKVSNSMIANGSIIGGKVENSVLFRSVKIGKGSVVRNSIIMQKTVIGENCILDGVILDKDVKIADGTVITKENQVEYPYVVQKGLEQGALMNS